jgi:hypothetical protein
MTDIAATIETFVELVTDFQVELDATSDQQLSDMKYHLYLVPASQQWEVIFEYVHPPGIEYTTSAPDMEPIYNGELTDSQRGQHILQSVVDEEFPLAAIAGPITVVMLPRYNERALNSTFDRMLPRLRTAARLLSKPDDEAVDESGADAGDTERSDFASATDTVPTEYCDAGKKPIGPLEGSGAGLAKLVTRRPNAKRDDLLRRHVGESVFVRKIGERKFEVYFRKEVEYEAAKKPLVTAPNNT